MFNENVSRRVSSVQFGLFSPEEIKNGSVCNVIYPETMESGSPKESGLIDLRMGTTERSLYCQTCNGTSFECPGHFGHIELCKPMFHVGYLSKTKKLLECVCFYCSKLKSRKNLPRGLDNCWDVLKSKTICDSENENGEKIGCCNKQPIIKKDGLNLIAYMKGNDDEGKVILNGERVYNIFKKISKDDYKFLGFNSEFCHPEHMLFTVVLVSPPSMRPSIVLGSGLRGEDDLTHKYADIVKSNSLLKKYEQEGAPGHIVRDYEQLLQFHLATLINNDIGGQPQALQKSGRPLKSLTARLKGKEGRVRGNLMGKRVDFSARSVITPDSNISLDEVGVPIEVAKIHTFPEKVNSFNINELQKLVNNGPNEYPGANYVIRNDSQRIDLHYNRHELRLEKGFIVERHMKDGDNILFNRQPSLHKMSMMGHKARVMENKTFRLNLSVTAPYNADFDGDEMNLHMPQSYNSRSELDSLANVENQIISPQSNKPVVGIVQDTLVGLRLFTLKDTFFNRRETMNLLYSFNGEYNFHVFMKPTICSPIELWTGKQIFSAILPCIYYAKAINSPKNIPLDEELQNEIYKLEDIAKERSLVPNRLSLLKEFHKNIYDDFLLIKSGMLLTGVLDKKSCGAQQGGLIHIVVNDCGNSVAKHFINAIQKLINYFMLHISSFSIGIGDAFVDNPSVKASKDNIRRAMGEVDILIESAKKNELEKMPGLSMMETFESKVNTVLNKARDYKGQISIYNNMNAMIMSGSKGSTINISQMTSCIGQQNVEGKRIPFGFEQRSLPHFLKYDFSAKSKGFVENSYFTGMTPYEFFFHAMGGREGLIDTAIKTAETGYIQRRLVKALEDATARHDYSVRNGNGQIYQFMYGEDSFDATHLENVTIDKTDFKKRFFIDMFVDLEYEIRRNEVSQDVYAMLRKDLDLQIKLDEEYEYLSKHINILDSGYASPVNIERILKEHINSLRNAHANDYYTNNNYATIKVHENSFATTSFTVSPYVVLDTLDSLMTSNHFLNYYIRYSMNMRTCLTKLNSESFFSIINAIKSKIFKARINANEMVGTLAAQSVGEPATQMTLNTFHLAGVASTVTMGVPRLNEIINVSRTIKTPSLRIFLKENDINSVRIVQNKIEYVCLEDLYKSSMVVYDSDVMSTSIEDDLEFVTNYFEMPDEEVDYSKLGKFVIRIELNRYSLISRNISIEDIASKIRQFYKEKSIVVHIINSDENDQKLILRIRFEVGDTEYLDYYHDKEEKLLKMHVKGLENIKKAYLTKDNSVENNKEEESRWSLQTDGINFQSILSTENVDAPRVIPNDFYVVFETLGIEAARQSIINELNLVMEANGSYVNNRHLSLLADVMTVCGYLTGITRHGVNREMAAGALKKASFEETVDILLDAAVDSECNYTRGITENIMLGQLAPLGTGNVELILDIKKLDASKLIYQNTSSFAIRSPASESGAFSPISCFSPSSNNSIFSPAYSSSMEFSPAYNEPTLQSPSYLQSPTYNPEYNSLYSPSSPNYSPRSPSGFSMSPRVEGDYSPSSPTYLPCSPTYSPTSPGYSPKTQIYSPMTPGFSPNGSYRSALTPKYSPKSPSYTPKSPGYSPQSGRYINPRTPKKSEDDKKYS